MSSLRCRPCETTARRTARLMGTLQVLVGGDQFGGITLTHPYIPGQYKKIGVCDGRSLYQHVNNTEIFLYYVCGRWFIGLEVGEGNKKYFWS